MFERADRQAKNGFPLTPAPLIFFLYLLILSALFVFHSCHAAENRKDVKEETIKNFSEGHSLPQRSCRVIKDNISDYSDISGQIIREFDHALIRLKIADQLFGCSTNYSFHIFPECVPAAPVDVTQSVKVMMPRVAATTEIKYNLYPNDREYDKKKILSMLSKDFSFESGVPFGVSIPSTSPQIDDVECGYCQSEKQIRTASTEASYDYRICLFFRKSILRDVSASVVPHFESSK